ncbi:MAG: dihydrolipoyl dehydrogenase [Myxococcota bacterium]
MGDEVRRFDVAVIGGGPGGYVAAIRASQLGLDACCIERDRLGGICLNWGCIPSKALLYTAELFQKLSDGEKWGFEVEGLKADWPKVIQRSRKVADRLNKGVAGLLKKYGVTHISGEATIERPGRVAVGDEIIEAKHVIVATGARARALPGLDFDGDRIMTYREAMVLDAQPDKVLVVGGGAIGCEFAYFFNGMGTEVTLVEVEDRILPVEEPEVSDVVAKSFGKQGIDVRPGTMAADVEKTKGGVKARLKPASGDDEGEVVEFDRVLVAVGVVGNTEGLGLEQAGVEFERGTIEVDADLKTTTPGIYAIGDVAGPPWLAHKASAEGVHCVERIAGHPGKPVDYGNIPACTYCQPQVASVGLTEEAAREAGHDLKVGTFPFMASGKALAVGASEGFAKVIFDAGTGELLGCHMVGHGVTDLVSEAVLARSGELTEAELLAAVHPHPTLSEAIHEAVGQAYGESVNF